MPGNESIRTVLLESLYDAVYMVDRERRITFWNAAAEELTGYTAGEVIGRHCFENLLRHVDEQGNSLCSGICPVSLTLKDGLRRSEEIYLHHKDGHRVPVSVRVAPLRDNQGALIGAIEVFSDNSVKAQLNERVRELERLALLDPLTGLPNRRYLEIQLGSRMDELTRYAWPFGILLMDIDDFKQVNDLHGHLVGDRVFRMVARTLSANARVFDVIGRWGGDEFLAILTNVDQGRLAQVAERFRYLVESSQLEEPAAISVTVSIGATLATPEDSVESLLERADGLLYRAKDSGRNQVQTENLSADLSRVQERGGK